MTSESSGARPPSYLSVQPLSRVSTALHSTVRERDSSTHIPPVPVPVLTLEYEPPPPERQPLWNPPGYNASRDPTVPVTYSFSRVSSSAMILIPPEDFPDSRPRYHISVNLNCFMPSSYITTIHRGATENGQFVGDFEMGISKIPATVSFRGKETKIKDILKKSWVLADSGVWRWRCPGKEKTLIWHWQSVPLSATCKVQARKGPAVIVAKFMPASRLRREGNPVDLSRLEILPEGQEDFDDILISVLIVQREKLTPVLE